MMRLHAALLALLLCACSAEKSSGDLVSFPTLGENWIIVNYWAEWCAPCREEIPELNKLAARSTDIDVYALNFDGVQGEALQQQAQEMGIAFPMLSADPGPRLGIARPTVLPTTLILSPEGDVVTRLIGPQTASGLRGELELAREKQSQKKTN